MNVDFFPLETSLGPEHLDHWAKGRTVIRGAVSRKGRPVYLLDWRESPYERDEDARWRVTMTSLPESFRDYFVNYLFSYELYRVDTHAEGRGSILCPSKKLRYGGYESHFRRLYGKSAKHLRRYLDSYPDMEEMRRRYIEALIMEAES